MFLQGVDRSTCQLHARETSLHVRSSGEMITNLMACQLIINIGIVQSDHLYETNSIEQGARSVQNLKLKS